MIPWQNIVAAKGFVARKPTPATCHASLHPVDVSRIPRGTGVHVGASLCCAFSAGLSNVVYHSSSCNPGCPEVAKYIPSSSSVTWIENPDCIQLQSVSGLGPSARWVRPTGGGSKVPAGLPGTRPSGMDNKRLAHVIRYHISLQDSSEKAMSLVATAFERHGRFQGSVGT